MGSLSRSPSEGEIVETDNEKAHKLLHSTSNTSIDRHSRKRYSVSRSPSPRLSPPRQKSSTRSRSRSPYRERRGSKRSRDDDHYGRSDRDDPRRFKVRYEERRYNDRSRGRRNSYRDLDRGGTTGSPLRYDDRGSGRSREQRNRSISRSPPRFSKGPFDEEASRSGRLESRGFASNGQIQSRMDQGLVSTSLPSSDKRKGRNELARQDQRKVQFDVPKQTSRSTTEPSLPADSDTMQMDDKPLDEAALIEERRKRREAIRAKYKRQDTPLLVQALSLKNEVVPDPSETDVHAIATPSEISPRLSPPQTPNPVSGQESPTDFKVDNDEELANSAFQNDDEAQADEPSAADYDPTMDMQEDKLRQDFRKDDVSSSAYDETKNNQQDVLLPESLIEAPKKQLKDEYDMFADEEEDVSFNQADFPAPRSDGGSQSGRAIPVPRSKALDMSMLDDWDDEEGYYKIILGELLEGRYHVQLNLGKGMFSGVVRAMDQSAHKLVAIKIIRSNETMKKAGLKEIEILEKLKHADPEDKKHMIRLERSFEHKGHLCMVFEHLSINLREVLKKFGRDVGINITAVRAYAHQMFLGLTLMRKCNILHADLKPDNVLVNESRNLLKICDLGSASDASENEITPYLVSRFYRAPEIILGMPYDFAIDTWSIGCTLFELFTGKILFTGRTNNQMLRSIMECRGKFSHKMLRKAQFAPLHFDDLLNFRSVEKDKLSGKDVVRILNFAKPTRDLRTRLMANAKGLPEAEVKELAIFVDLLDKCLNLNPEKRCSPSEALRHPFITRVKA